MFFNLFLNAIRVYLRNTIISALNRKRFIGALAIISVIIFSYLASGWFGVATQPPALAAKVPTRNNQDLCFCLSSRSYPGV